MRKIVLALALALTVTGCAGTQKLFDTVVAGVTIATGQFASPVTREHLHAFENTMIVGFAGLNAYRNACVRGTIDQKCKATIRHMQTYTRRIPTMLAQVRVYVDRGDQNNALTTYQTLQTLWSEFKAIAAANNVRVQ